MDDIILALLGATVIEGVSRTRDTLISGQLGEYDWEQGYTCHQLGVGAIVVQLAQPYILASMRLLLWDCDDRSYAFDIYVSTDRKNWQLVVRNRYQKQKIGKDIFPCMWRKVNAPSSLLINILNNAGERNMSRE